MTAISSSGRVRGRTKRAQVRRFGGKIVDGFAVKGRACPNPGEVLLSAGLQGPDVLAISYISSRSVQARRNGTRMVNKRSIRTVLCVKHNTPDGGDHFWVVNVENTVKL
jgi:hypothetical protein